MVQRVYVSAGTALCRFCGESVPTNTLSTHIASKHPRQKTKNLKPRLVKSPGSVKDRSSK